MIDTPKEAATGDKAAQDLMLSELLQVCTQGSWLLDGLTVYALEHDGWNKGEEQFSNSFWASVQSGKNATGINHLNANAKLIALAPTIAAELIKQRAINIKLVEILKDVITDIDWTIPIEADTKLYELHCEVLNVIKQAEEL